MIEIRKLKKEEYAKKSFVTAYQTKGYYDIQRSLNGFEIQYKKFEIGKILESK